MVRKRRQHHGPENHERWMVSYADFVTLLFALFVVMYAVSSVNEGKYRVLSEAMADAFRPVSINNKRQWASAESPLPADLLAQTVVTPILPYRIAPDLRPLPMVAVAPEEAAEPAEAACPTLEKPVVREPPVMDKKPLQVAMAVDAPDPDEQKTVVEKPPATPIAEESSGQVNDDPMLTLATRLENSVADLIEADLVRIRREGSWVELEMKNHMLFDSASNLINTDAVPAIRQIATVLRDIPNRIHVEGFTDDIPINTSLYPSNWELSAARAASVVHLLMDEGLAPERMAAVGYGEHRPIADNATEQGRIQNRRVVLVILDNADIDRRIHEASNFAGMGNNNPSTAADMETRESLVQP
jgi:chemotaxis protein MotB